MINPLFTMYIITFCLGVITKRNFFYKMADAFNNMMLAYMAFGLSVFAAAAIRRMLPL